MWNDTVRRQTESSFIAADVNNTPTLNRGTRVYSSDMLADKECAIYFLPLYHQLLWGTIFLLTKCCRLMLEPLHMTQCWPRDIINPLPPQVHPNTVLYTPCFSGYSFLLLLLSFTILLFMYMHKTLQSSRLC